jgi:hypothetical protein
MALPKPLSQRPTGMPQMRRKSTLRTASANLQGAFLERVRAVRDDPLVLLPTAVGPEPRELAALRKGLEAAGRGKLGFFARRDKGVLGAAWSCRALADRKEVPRLLDARIDGERRFYLPTGHVRKTACLGVQNWDEPLALLLAYEGMAEAGLHFFAGRDLWCTGPSATLVADWVEDLAERAGADLTLDGAHARCPHADRAALAHVLPGGPEIRLCASCATDDFGTLLQARVRNPGGRRPTARAKPSRRNRTRSTASGAPPGRPSSPPRWHAGTARVPMRTPSATASTPRRTSSSTPWRRRPGCGPPWPP